MNPATRRIPPVNVRRARQCVRDFMTPSPLTIGRTTSLSAAKKTMREAGVRHLPVLEAGRLIGVVSQRDAYMVETLPGVDPDTNTVADAMSIDVYTVKPEEPVSEVVRAMISRKYGCAVVTEGTHVLGVFSTIDALRAMLASINAEN
jgi:acetoin utilization protein AcuB